METWKIALIGGGVILLIVLIAVGIYFLTRKEDTTPAPTTSRSPSGTTTSSPSNTTTSSPSGPTSSPSPSGNNTLPPTTSPSPAPEPSRYYLAKQCPEGLQDMGAYGVILKNEEYSRNPFNPGTLDRDDGWRWAHPRLCYGVAEEDQLNKLYGFSKTNTGNLIASGIIQVVEKGKDPFPSGGDHGSGWSWRHPYLQTADKPGNYYPELEGDFKIGMIVKNEDKNKSPFENGDPHNNWWTWQHPWMKLNPTS
jgi:hypothetical protein